MKKKEHTKHIYSFYINRVSNYISLKEKMYATYKHINKKKDYRRSPTFVNLKSNTMKNTMQKYSYLPYLANVFVYEFTLLPVLLIYIKFTVNYF